jgi:hypothetical protein
MKHTAAFLLLLVTATACGGGGGGPTAPGGSSAPNVAGVWIVNRTVGSTTCGPVNLDAIPVVVTQQANSIQISTQLQLGNFNYAGSIQSNGNFSASFNGLITGAGVVLAANISGKFTTNSISGSESVQFTDAQSGESCNITVEWLGNRST